MAKAAKRILTELRQFNSIPLHDNDINIVDNIGEDDINIQREGGTFYSTPSISTSSRSKYIEELAPNSSDNVLQLSAILSGRSLPPETGYANGRWLVSIDVPTTYPNTPPNIQFITKICHPNIQWETGKVCLDVLNERWTPVLGVVGALDCVGRLLAEGATDSPLGIEVAALERTGDLIGKRSLVGYWCEEERWNGSLENPLRFT